MLEIHYGNRIEQLADRLIGVLASCRPDPLAPQTVVVPHPEMGRWLARRMARDHSICANVAFDLPVSALWREAARGLEEFDGEDPLAPDLLALRLMQQVQADPPPAMVGGLPEDTRGRWRLCQRLAGLYNDYLLFRPEWVLSWEQGRDSHWQAELWRRVVTPGQVHWARLLERCAGRTAPPGPPLRVFAGAGLAPSLLGLLAHLGESREVSIDLWTPCREYWGDAESGRGRFVTGAALDHPLLGSLGAQLRDYFDGLQAFDAGGGDHFVDEPATTTLTGLRAGMLGLAEAPVPGDPPDAPSLVLHGCHSRRREVEVCHDQLLDAFERDPDLTPDAVQVLAPDIDAYAPHIEAVFGCAEAALRLPYRVLGQRDAPDGVPRIILELLAVLAGEVRLPALMDLLRHRPLARRFGIGESERDVVAGWLAGAAPLNPADPDSKYSWDKACQRLVLGSVLEGDREFHGLRRAGVVGGGEDSLLAGLLALVERLDRRSAALAGERSLTDWSRWIGRLPDEFLRLDAEAINQRQGLDRALARLRRRAELAAFDSPLDAPTVLELLTGELDELADAARGEAGGITFASARRLRQVPCRVRYVLGLNDGEFPAARDLSDLDLIQSRGTRRGDRSRRDDDRQMVLEWLGTTGERLFFSHQARDERDNSERRPSPPLLELDDCLERCGRIGGGTVCLPRADHPVQPYSDRYGGDDVQWFTYRRDWAASTPTPSILQPLQAEVEAEQETVTLAALGAFLSNPLRRYFRVGLGLHLDRDFSGDDELPLDLDALGAYWLRSEILAEDEVTQRWIAADVRVPDGTVGGAAVSHVQAVTGRMRQLAQRLQGDQPLETVSLEPGAGDELPLAGPITGVAGDLRVDLRPGRLKPAFLLQQWAAHLALQLVRPKDAPSTVLVYLDGQAVCEARLAPVADARRHLADLLALYRQAAHEPLWLLPESSHEYARHHAREGHRRALARAHHALYTSRYPEGGDVWVRLALREGDPLNEAFGELALRVWSPLLAVLERP